MSEITPEMIECWRKNYGIDKERPEEAAKWWADHCDGMAPAGAVAALGLLLQKRVTVEEAVAAERERCATLCEQVAMDCECWEEGGTDGAIAARSCAGAIRIA